MRVQHNYVRACDVSRLFKNLFSLRARVGCSNASFLMIFGQPSAGIVRVKRSNAIGFFAILFLRGQPSAGIVRVKRSSARVFSSFEVCAGSPLRGSRASSSQTLRSLLLFIVLGQSSAGMVCVKRSTVRVLAILVFVHWANLCRDAASEVIR